MASVLLAARAQAQPVEPRMVIGLDTSGSALGDLCGTGTTVDDSVECPGADVACMTCNAAGCGNVVADDSVLWKMKAAAAQVISGPPAGVEWALARMHQDPVLFACTQGGWVGGGPSWQRGRARDR